MFKQQLHHFHSVLLASNVKWSETILHTERKKKKKLSVMKPILEYLPWHPERGELSTVTKHLWLWDCFYRADKGKKMICQEMNRWCKKCLLQTTEMRKKPFISQFLLLLFKYRFLEIAWESLSIHLCEFQIYTSEFNNWTTSSLISLPVLCSSPLPQLTLYP